MRKAIAILITLLFPINLCAEIRFTGGGSGTATFPGDGSGSMVDSGSGEGGVTEATLEQTADNRSTYGSAPDPGSITVTFTAPDTNNLIFTAICVDKNAVSFTQPTNFTMIHSGVSGVASSGSSGAFAYKISDGTETSLEWTYTATSPNAEEGNAVVLEYSGINSSDPLDQPAENETNVTTTVSGNSTGTTAATDEANELAIALYCSDSGNSASIGSSTPRLSWSNSFTNIFEEPVPEESGNPFLAIATKNLTATGTVETTGTHGVSDESYAGIATFHLQ